MTADAIVQGIVRMRARGAVTTATVILPVALLGGLRRAQSNLFAPVAA